MSTYEKIATLIIVILVVPMIIFSYRELKEPPETHGAPPSSRFDESLGQHFKIGAFSNVSGEHSSGGVEDNCENYQTVIIGVLHDIKERLEHMKAYAGIEDAFEVNTSALQLFCNKNADVTLTDKDGNGLLLKKIPFARKTPQGSPPSDIGTEVHIDATLLPKGAPMPVRPTTFGEFLIPDRFLDATTSSSH